MFALPLVQLISSFYICMSALNKLNNFVPQKKKIYTGKKYTIMTK